MTAAAAKATREDQLAEKVKNLRLDDLKNRSLAELDELFNLATTPTISEVKGPYDGRVLTGPMFPLGMADGLNMVNLSWWIPWAGKAFTPVTKTTGKGKNRMRVGPFKALSMPFESKILPPLYGKDDCYVLDYDIPQNPIWLRLIRDDMKKLREGLFLGRANVKWKGDFIFALYFALSK